MGYIKDLIDNANPGDAITIPVGDYTENLEIDIFNKPNLTIIGAGPTLTKIHFSNTEYGILVYNSESITFKDFSIDSTYVGIKCQSTSAVVQNMDFHDTPSVGNEGYCLGIQLAENCLIENCTFTNSPDDGIIATDQSNVIINNCIFTHISHPIEFNQGSFNTWRINNCQFIDGGNVWTVAPSICQDIKFNNCSFIGGGHLSLSGDFEILDSSLDANGTIACSSGILRLTRCMFGDPYVYIMLYSVGTMVIDCCTGEWFSQNPEKITIIPCGNGPTPSPPITFLVIAGAGIIGLYFFLR